MSTRKLKVVVWKERDYDHRFFRMWRGRCEACHKTTQFWFFGATLGYMLEHMRRCVWFRNDPSLAVRPIRPVLSESAPSDMSGQTRKAGEPGEHLGSFGPRWPDAPVFGFRVRAPL